MKFWLSGIVIVCVCVFGISHAVHAQTTLELCCCYDPDSSGTCSEPAITISSACSSFTLVDGRDCNPAVPGTLCCCSDEDGSGDCNGSELDQTVTPACTNYNFMYISQPPSACGLGGGGDDDDTSDDDTTGGDDVIPTLPTGSAPTLGLTGGRYTLFNPLQGKGVTEPAGLVILIAGGFVGFLGLFSVMMVIYGGYMFIFSAGNPDMVKKGKQTIMWAVLGVAIAFFSVSMLNFILTRLG